MNLYTKQKQLTNIEKKLIVIKGEKGQEINWEFGISNIHTTIHKTGNKRPYCRAQGTTVSFIINYNGKEYEKEYIGV